MKNKENKIINIIFMITFLIQFILYLLGIIIPSNQQVTGLYCLIIVFCGLKIVTEDTK